MDPPSLEPGFHLEAKGHSEGFVEVECGGGCFAPAAPPAPPASADASPEDAGQDGGDASLAAGERAMENASEHHLNREDLEAQQQLPFQIFPEPVEVVLNPPAALNSVEQTQEKERLPSIVVEPTELSEVESGELRWPPETMETEEDEEEEEDLFLEQCIPPANIADWGDDEEVNEEASLLLTPQPGLTLIDLQSDAFRDDTPTLPPSSAPALN